MFAANILTFIRIKAAHCRTIKQNNRISIVVADQQFKSVECELINLDMVINAKIVFLTHWPN